VQKALQHSSFKDPFPAPFALVSLVLPPLPSLPAFDPERWLFCLTLPVLPSPSKHSAECHLVRSKSGHLHQNEPPPPASGTCTSSPHLFDWFQSFQESRFHLQIGFLGLVEESPAISTATAYVPYAQLGGRPSLSHDVLFCWPLPSSVYSWASRQISWVCSEFNMKNVDGGFCLFQSPTRDYVSISWLLDLTLEEGLELEQFKIYFETYRPQLCETLLRSQKFLVQCTLSGFLL